MALTLTGTLYSRDSRPYTLDDGKSGVSHKARVHMGRGQYADVKIPETLLGQVPPTSDIPEDGTAVSWEVSMQFGKLVYVGVAQAARHTSAVRAAS